MSQFDPNTIRTPELITRILEARVHESIAIAESTVPISSRPTTTHTNGSMIMVEPSAAPLSARVRTRSPVKLNVANKKVTRRTVPARATVVAPTWMLPHIQNSLAASSVAIDSSPPPIEPVPIVSVPLVNSSSMSALGGSIGRTRLNLPTPAASIPTFLDLLLHPVTHPALQTIKSVSQQRAMEVSQQAEAVKIYGPAWFRMGVGTQLAQENQQSINMALRAAAFAHPDVQVRLLLFWTLAKPKRSDGLLTFAGYRSLYHRLARSLLGRKYTLGEATKNCEQDWARDWGGVYSGASQAFSHEQGLPLQALMQSVFESVDLFLAQPTVDSVPLGPTGTMVKLPNIQSYIDALEKLWSDITMRSSPTSQQSSDHSALPSADPTDKPRWDFAWRPVNELSKIAAAGVGAPTDATHMEQQRRAHREYTISAIWSLLQHPRCEFQRQARGELLARRKTADVARELEQELDEADAQTQHQHPHSHTPHEYHGQALPAAGTTGDLHAEERKMREQQQQQHSQQHDLHHHQHHTHSNAHAHDEPHQAHVHHSPAHFGSNHVHPHPISHPHAHDSGSHTVGLGVMLPPLQGHAAHPQPRTTQTVGHAHGQAGKKHPSHTHVRSSSPHTTDSPSSGELTAWPSKEDSASLLLHPSHSANALDASPKSPPLVHANSTGSVGSTGSKDEKAVKKSALKKPHNLAAPTASMAGHVPSHTPGAVSTDSDSAAGAASTVAGAPSSSSSAVTPSSVSPEKTPAGSTSVSPARSLAPSRSTSKKSLKEFVAAMSKGLRTPGGRTPMGTRTPARSTSPKGAPDSPAILPEDRTGDLLKNLKDLINLEKVKTEAKMQQLEASGVTGSDRRPMALWSLVASAVASTSTSRAQSKGPTPFTSPPESQRASFAILPGVPVLTEDPFGIDRRLEPAISEDATSAAPSTTASTVSAMVPVTVAEKDPVATADSLETSEAKDNVTETLPPSSNTDSPRPTNRRTPSAVLNQRVADLFQLVSTAHDTKASSVDAVQAMVQKAQQMHDASNMELERMPSFLKTGSHHETHEKSAKDSPPKTKGTASQDKLDTSSPPKSKSGSKTSSRSQSRRGSLNKGLQVTNSLPSTLEKAVSKKLKPSAKQGRVESVKQKPESDEDEEDSEYHHVPSEQMRALQAEMLAAEKEEAKQAAVAAAAARAKALAEDAAAQADITGSTEGGEASAAVADSSTLPIDDPSLDHVPSTVSFGTDVAYAAEDSTTHSIAAQHVSISTASERNTWNHNQVLLAKAEAEELRHEYRAEKALQQTLLRTKTKTQRLKEQHAQAALLERQAMKQQSEREDRAIRAKELAELKAQRAAERQKELREKRLVVLTPRHHKNASQKGKKTHFAAALNKSTSEIEKSASGSNGTEAPDTNLFALESIIASTASIPVSEGDELFSHLVLPSELQPVAVAPDSPSKEELSAQKEQRKEDHLKAQQSDAKSYAEKTERERKGKARKIGAVTTKVQIGGASPEGNEEKSSSAASPLSPAPQRQSALGVLQIPTGPLSPVDRSLPHTPNTFASSATPISPEGSFMSHGSSIAWSRASSKAPQSEATSKATSTAGSGNTSRVHSKAASLAPSRTGSPLKQTRENENGETSDGDGEVSTTVKEAEGKRTEFTSSLAILDPSRSGSVEASGANTSAHPSAAQPTAQKSNLSLGTKYELQQVPVPLTPLNPESMLVTQQTAEGEIVDPDAIVQEEFARAAAEAAAEVTQRTHGQREQNQELPQEQPHQLDPQQAQEQRQYEQAILMEQQQQQVGEQEEKQFLPTPPASSRTLGRSGSVGPFAHLTSWAELEQALLSAKTPGEVQALQKHMLLLRKSTHLHRGSVLEPSHRMHPKLYTSSFALPSRRLIDHMRRVESRSRMGLAAEESTATNGSQSARAPTSTDAHEPDWRRSVVAPIIIGAGSMQITQSAPNTARPSGTHATEEFSPEQLRKFVSGSVPPPLQALAAPLAPRSPPRGGGGGGGSRSPSRNKHAAATSEFRTVLPLVGGTGAWRGNARKKARLPGNGSSARIPAVALSPRSLKKRQIELLQRSQTMFGWAGDLTSSKANLREEVSPQGRQPHAPTTGRIGRARARATNDRPPPALASSLAKPKGARVDWNLLDSVELRAYSPPSRASRLGSSAGWSTTGVTGGSSSRPETSSLLDTEILRFHRSSAEAKEALPRGLPEVDEHAVRVHDAEYARQMAVRFDRGLSVAPSLPDSVIFADPSHGILASEINIDSSARREVLGTALKFEPRNSNTAEPAEGEQYELVKRQEQQVRLAVSRGELSTLGVGLGGFLDPSSRFTSEDGDQRSIATSSHPSSAQSSLFDGLTGHGFSPRGAASERSYFRSDYNVGSIQSVGTGYEEEEQKEPSSTATRSAKSSRAASRDSSRPRSTANGKKAPKDAQGILAAAVAAHASVKDAPSSSHITSSSLPPLSARSSAPTPIYSTVSKVKSGSSTPKSSTTKTRPSPPLVSSVSSSNSTSPRTTSRRKGDTKATGTTTGGQPQSGSNVVTAVEPSKKRVTRNGSRPTSGMSTHTPSPNLRAVLEHGVNRSGPHVRTTSLDLGTLSGTPKQIDSPTAVQTSATPASPPGHARKYSALKGSRPSSRADTALSVSFADGT